MNHCIDFQIKKMSEIYSNLDIVALTSNNEKTTVSLIEAMASSVPVIATDVGGVRDLLGNSQLDIVSDDFKICERGILRMMPKALPTV